MLQYLRDTKPEVVFLLGGMVDEEAFRSLGEDKQHHLHDWPDVPEVVEAKQAGGFEDMILKLGELALDTHTGSVTLAGRPITLTAQESRLLAYLLHAAPRIVTRTELSEHVYDRDHEPDSNVIDVQISRLRRKLGNQRIDLLRVVELNHAGGRLVERRCLARQHAKVAHGVVIGVLGGGFAVDTADADLKHTKKFTIWIFVTAWPRIRIPVI